MSAAIARPRTRFVALLVALVAAFTALTPISPAAAATFTIPVTQADFAEKQDASYLWFMPANPTSIVITFPTELASLTLANFYVSLENMDGTVLVAPTAHANNGSTMTVPVSVSVGTGLKLVVNEFANDSDPAYPSIDGVHLTANLHTGSATSAANVPINLSSSEAMGYSSSFWYDASQVTLAVVPGDVIEFIGTAGLWTTGPNGTWIDNDGGDARTGAIDQNYVTSDAQAEISANGSTLTTTVGRPYATWNDGETMLQFVLNGNLAGPLPRAQLIFRQPLDYIHVAHVALDRIQGADRYEVAVSISEEGFPDGADVIYIAKGTDYPDALSAAPAAAFDGGPLLLTLPTSLPAVVKAEIQRLAPAKIVVVGGTASISASVFAELDELASEVIRIGGSDRFEASRNLVNYTFMEQNGDAGVARVYVATGNNFPDALSASAAAGAYGDAVVLVPGGFEGTLDTPTYELIFAMSPFDAVVAGGPVSVNEGVLNSLQLMSFPYGAYRVWGEDRFEASWNIVRDGFSEASEIFIATGLKFPDALAGAALAGFRGAPLYVVPSNCVPQEVLDDIDGYRVTKVTLLGGLASLDANVGALTSCTPPV
jgi:putative cell wall-binding protein